MNELTWSPPRGPSPKTPILAPQELCGGLSGRLHLQKKDQETPTPSDHRSLGGGGGRVDLYGNARLLRQRLGGGASDNTGHTSILHVATVSFAPARKFALVDGVFSPRARHIIHPDQTSTWTQKHRDRERGGGGEGGGVKSWTFYSEVRTFYQPNSTVLHPVLQQDFIALKWLLMKCLCSLSVYSLQIGCFVCSNHKVDT